MKTDPQNSDYIVESGASRNYEPWRAEDEVRSFFLGLLLSYNFWGLLSYHVFSCVQEVDKEQQKRDAEEMGDAMKSLENRTLDSKREMDIIAALDEMKSMKVCVTHYHLPNSLCCSHLFLFHASFTCSDLLICVFFLLFGFLQSRHATVSVDAMLEALQRTGAEKVMFLLQCYISL